MPDTRIELEAGIVNRAYDGECGDVFKDGEVATEPIPAAVIDTTKSTTVDRNTPPPANRIAALCRYTFLIVNLFQQYIGCGASTVYIIASIYASVLGAGKRQTKICVVLLWWWLVLWWWLADVLQKQKLKISLLKSTFLPVVRVSPGVSVHRRYCQLVTGTCQFVSRTIAVRTFVVSPEEQPTGKLQMHGSLV